MVALFRPSCNLLPECSGPPDTNLIPSQRTDCKTTKGKRAAGRLTTGGSGFNLRSMPMAELIIQLPAEQIEFLKNYAQQHGTTVAEILASHVSRLRAADRPPL